MTAAPKETATDSPTVQPSVGHLIPLGLLAIWIMAPVTLPVPVLRELVQERFDVSELVTSLFMSINMLGALIAAPLIGVLTDRIARRRPLLVGLLLADAACFFVLASPIPFPLFLVIRFVEGCAHIGALSILLMFASNALPPEQRGRAMGVVGGSMMLGVALGAPLGGALGQSSALLPLRAGGALLVAGSVLAWAFVREGGSREGRPGLGEIISTLRRHPDLLAPLAFAFADRFTVGFFTTTFSLYLRRIYDLPPTSIGLAIATFMLPFALLSYPFGRLGERVSLTLLLCLGSTLYGIGTMFVGFTGPPEVYFLMFGIGLTAAVMFVPSMVMTTELAPGRIRATALGAFNAAGSLGFIIGPLTGGWISQVVAGRLDWLTGYRAAFVVAGASELLCVALALPILLRLRRRGLVR
jgi:MFS family permease